MKLITAKQAAKLTHVPVGTVESWRRRGLLKPAMRAEHLRGNPHLYSPKDVLLAERDARRRDPTRRRATKLAETVSRDRGWSQSGISASP
jgi:DNA-binding transcriptional MerR regulator